MSNALIFLEIIILDEGCLDHEERICIMVEYMHLHPAKTILLKLNYIFTYLIIDPSKKTQNSLCINSIQGSMIP